MKAGVERGLGLPPESLVSFPARKLRSAVTIYCTEDIGAGSDWSGRYGYLVPSELESEASFTTELKQFQAERYGGHGIGCHGGGARCGLLGDYQVKGIGRNPLIGEREGTAHFWHAHGAVSLMDAIQEAAWGEILHAALPHGAVRNAALISTGTSCWYEEEGGVKVPAPRALVVRQAALRPAHFFRAIFFRASDGTRMVSDAARVQAAITRLPELLPMPSRIGSGDALGLQRSRRVGLGLMEMAHRFAAQSAAACAKRLMHGTLNPSNLALDGRWLDFGTATALPSYANTKNFGLPEHVPTFWEESERVPQILMDLCFYCRKYLSPADAAAVPVLERLAGFFIASRNEELQRSFVRLAGFPECLLRSAWRDESVRRLGSLLIEVARRDAHRPFIPARPDLAVFGDSPLELVLPTLAAEQASHVRANRIARSVGNERRVAELVACYDAVLALVTRQAANAGVEPSALRFLIALNAAKSGYDNTPFRRPEMNRQARSLAADVAAASDGAPAIQSWVDVIRDDAAIFYGPNSSFQSLAWRRRTRSVHYDAVHDQWICTDRGSRATHRRRDLVSEAALAEVRPLWETAKASVEA